MVAARIGKTSKNYRHFLWDYRGRVLLALASLVLAKLANVGVPDHIKRDC